MDITNQDHLPEAACKILTFAGDSRIFTFTGPMGAGKTTLIKAMCKSLGSKDNFSSPTYAIVNEYHSPQGKIFHFDLYRIKAVEELYDIGFEEYISVGNYCFIEWPEMASDFVKMPYCGINFFVDENSRKIIVENHKKV